ncbi:unnamed protein product [Leptidea sinapis]|uniref:Uncharacterized protein n=1 Tax=Leptidea sinapis TaxID=189913 RepID=A0A5E4QPE4_9NEOP|nr:unnamed protein product [Leptidea sinapis]
MSKSEDSMVSGGFIDINLVERMINKYDDVNLFYEVEEVLRSAVLQDSDTSTKRGRQGEPSTSSGLTSVNDEMGRPSTQQPKTFPQIQFIQRIDY